MSLLNWLLGMPFAPDPLPDQARPTEERPQLAEPAIVYRRDGVREEIIADYRNRRNELEAQKQMTLAKAEADMRGSYAGKYHVLLTDNWLKELRARMRPPRETPWMLGSSGYRKFVKRHKLWN